jgi:energy-coupling factor transporter ATP-binding protein EcfA2
MVDSRKIVVTGHYGSGKTEFAVSLAMLRRAAQEIRSPVSAPYQKTALIDLDIVNPYFRSREHREMLENVGITVYGSLYKTEITAELPALGASLRAPLEDSSCRVIVDMGGNDTGALVINQFTKYLSDDAAILLVVNANRPDTATSEKVLEHITAIEEITGLCISGIVNNTHMLRETTADDIIKGHELCKQVCEETGKHIVCDCYPGRLINPEELTGLSEYLMPLGLYMRPSWLDS